MFYRYSCCIMMSIDIGPKWSFYSRCDYIGLLGTCFMQVLYLGRAPRTKETLPDFLKWHPLVFRGLTGSQRTLVNGPSGNGASHLGPVCLTFLKTFFYSKKQGKHI